MPRTQPTTSWSEATRPSAPNWGTDRFWERLTCDTTDFTCDSTLITCDATKVPWTFIQSSYDQPRYWKYVQDLTWWFVFDLLWQQVQWVSWDTINKINSIYN